MSMKTEKILMKPGDSGFWKELSFRLPAEESAQLMEAMAVNRRAFYPSSTMEDRAIMAPRTPFQPSGESVFLESWLREHSALYAPALAVLDEAVQMEQPDDRVSPPHFSAECAPDGVIVRVHVIGERDA